MTPEQTKQLAALRERLNSDMRGVAFNQTSHTFNVTIADVCFLLDLLADAERDRKSAEEFLATARECIDLRNAELATATERAERAADAIDRDALVSWLVSKDRKPPEAAFTTGSNRFVADLVVIAESYATQKAADARQAERRFRFDLLQQINYLAGDKSCPCGAREETPETHPHVSGCGIGKLRREFADAIEAGAAKGGGDG